MRLLVTGGTGFIGSHLAEEGRRRGAEVVVLGLTDRPEEQANAALLQRQGVQILAGSITDEALCRRAGVNERFPEIREVVGEGHVGSTRHFCIPPDTEMSSPVTNDDASLAR